MVIVTSVFLVQLLCVIVPCDPRYRLPDLSPDPHRLEITGRSSSHYGKIQKKHGRFWDAFPVKFNEVLPNYLDAFDDEDYKLNRYPIVKTHSGVVQGYPMKVVGGRIINAFQGIPYGETPVRFKSPVPKKPWKGTLKAFGEAEACLQYNVPRVFRVFGKEDCLYLNVYSAQLPTEVNPKPKLPVIVFIHGGGFFFGAPASYGPSYFMQKDIVMVAFQYRLGILGFMSSGDAASPGNWGLKDQVLALKWIHENIEFFGGDPNRITIMGQSAGSVQVHLHMLSKRSRPYFHRAISMSGTAFNYWGYQDQYQARNLTSTLAELVGCPTLDSFEMVKCLRDTDPIKLVAQTPMFLDTWPYPGNAFQPAIEPFEDNPDAFITESPLEIYRKGEVAKVPWIVTSCSGEGYSFLLFPYITFQLPTLRKNWYHLAPNLIDIDTLDVDQEGITEKVTQFYFRTVPPKKASVHNFAKVLMDMIVTDRSFVTGIYKAIQAHTQVAPTYSYIFDFNGQYNAIINYGYPNYQWGVGHAEDIFYIFNSSAVYQGFNREDPEFKISQLIVNLFVNFAAKGEPVYTNGLGEDLKVWSPHDDPDHLNFLKIGKRIKMIRDPFKKRGIISFWDKLGIPNIPPKIIVQQPYPNEYIYGDLHNNTLGSQDLFTT